MEKKEKKVNAFKTMAEAFLFGRLKNFELPTSRVDRRRLTVDEIKNIVEQEFGKAKDANKVKAKDAPRGWGDAEIENEVNWIKALNLKEFFNEKTKKKAK